jgi:hypothetical protein
MRISTPWHGHAWRHVLDRWSMMHRGFSRLWIRLLQRFCANDVESAWFALGDAQVNVIRSISLFHRLVKR